MKYLNLIALLAALAALALVFTKDSESSAPKIGYVDSSILFEKAQIAAEARQKVAVEKEEIEKSIKEMEQKMATAHEEFIAQQANMKPDARQKRVQELARQEADLNNYAREAMNRAAAKETEIMEPVLQVINARIRRFGDAEGYAIIWGTTQGNILYGSKAADISDQVVRYINEQK